jgi:pimeloyl-ACP methyl ester carboxylesterase
VFHHGIGLTGAAWAGWHSQLESDFRLLAFDVRGYGRSPIDAERLAGRNLDAWAADLISLLDENGIESATVIGESLGGTAVLQAALRYPDRIQACVLCSTGFRGAAISELPTWHDLIERGGITAWSAYMNERRFDAATDPAVVAAVGAMQSACSPGVVLHDVDMLRGVDLSDALPGLRRPTLILAPGRSPFISREHAFELERLLPRSELVMIGPSKHGIAFAYADLCALLARRFLREVLGGLIRPAASVLRVQHRR